MRIEYKIRKYKYKLSKMLGGEEYATNICGDDKITFDKLQTGDKIIFTFVDSNNDKKSMLFNVTKNSDYVSLSR
jgi:hypothetical protein